MNNNAKSRKRSAKLSTSRVSSRKRLKSAAVEEFLQESDEEIYADSDVDDIDYVADKGNASSESEDEEEEGEMASEQCGAISRRQNLLPRRSSLPAMSALEQLRPRPNQTSGTTPAPEQPSRAASTTRWTTNSSSMRDFPFTKTNELLVPEPANPRGYLDLFLTDDYLQKIVDCTNRQAEKLKNSSKHRKGRIINWKPLTLEEFKIFIGLVYHSGTAKMNRLVDHWKSHRLYKSVFPEYMSRNRFQLILRCLHFVEEGEDPARMNKCKMIINTFNDTMDKIYYPGRNLSLAESMILFRGRLIFRQDIKGKRHKYGIKLYILAEPNGTILRAHVFASTLDETSGTGHTEKIVEKLLQKNLNYGHAVFMDNFYNSYGLATTLLDMNTYCTGTLNKKRKDNPSEVNSKKLKKGENISRYRNGVHIGKWKDKRELNYISTQFVDQMQELTNKRGNVVSKPLAIVQYNQNMSAVDLQDQMLSYYPCEGKALRWYVKIFIHVLMMNMINSRMLYNKYSGKPILSLYDFREQVIESLLPEHPVAPQVSEQKESHRLTKIEKTKERSFSTGRKSTVTARKDCRNCYSNKKRVNTTTECKQCPNSPPLCIDCFFDLHKFVGFSNNQ
ncbi:piggyBac transposable element-derived protein 4-like [Cydia fagiglandana]|uniref:piggyBac transposable element-derived protein 4-like n=1 Tax=Cydia fagiglandana TaxID=1458189 RepID=UPI002FEDE9D9